MPPAIALIGLGLTIFGTLFKASEQKKMLEYNAAVAEQNAKMAMDKAGYDAKMHNEQVRKMLGEQRALYGMSGVSSEMGSPLLVMNDSIKKGAMDTLAIRYGGKVQEHKYKSEATLYRAQGQSLMLAATIDAGAMLFKGAASMMGGGGGAGGGAGAGG